MPQSHPPKPPGQRRRRNVNEGPKWKQLPSDSGREAPPLPERDAGWSDQTVEWWETIWRSPMAALWLPADMGGLHELAELRQRFHDGEAVSNHIRALEDRFGLSPKARNMLAWQVPTEPGQAESGTSSPATPEPQPGDGRGRPTSVRRLHAVDTG